MKVRAVFLPREWEHLTSGAVLSPRDWKLPEDRVSVSLHLHYPTASHMSSVGFVSS